MPALEAGSGVRCGRWAAKALLAIIAVPAAVRYNFARILA